MRKSLHTEQKEQYNKQILEAKKLEQTLFQEETELQNSINSKTYFHGTMKDLSHWFDITKTNTAPAIFLSENETFADWYWIKRDEDLRWGRTYKATVTCKNTFNFKDKEKIRELRPLLQKLVLDWYTYEPSAIKIVKYPISSYNGIENPTLEQLVDYYIRRLENGARRMLESPPFIEYLKEKWYDSFTIRESGNDNIAVFDPSLVTFEWYKQENWERVNNIRKDYLLSQEYMNFWRLTNEEKVKYLKIHEEASALAWNWSDAELAKQKRIEAYEFLRTIYLNKANKEFLDSVDKIHWVNDIKDFKSILNSWMNITYDISTEWYYKESFLSAWGKGIWVKLSWETLMASNTDLRSDNRIWVGGKEWNLKKYSYGDSTSIILDKNDFLCHHDLQWTDRNGRVHKWHNEFLINNAKVEALIIDKDNIKLTHELEQEAISLAKKYNINIIYNKNISS